MHSKVFHRSYCQKFMATKTKNVVDYLYYTHIKYCNIRRYCVFSLNGVGVMDIPGAVLNSITTHGPEACDFMDVATTFGYGNYFCQQAVTTMDITGVPTRLSSGIMINEPPSDQPPDLMCRQQSVVPADVTGKGQKENG